MDISDLNILNILKRCKIDACGNDINGLLIERNSLLSSDIYDKLQKEIDILKTKYSSSSLTSLQSTAKKEQKWPLLNLVRQLLRLQNYRMEPIRKADGYTLDKKKKYKRYFKVILNTK